MNNKTYNTLKGEWVEVGTDSPDGFVSLLPHRQKLLLLSDGSLTVELEKLYGGELEVELKLNDYATLTPEEADYLMEDQECESVEREVWLNRAGRRLVFARTLIPLSCIDAGLRAALAENAYKPIGRVLTACGVSFIKKHLMVGMMECAEAATDLGLVPNAPLAARRYILTNTDFETNPVIKAVVTEVFSPEVITPVV
jgi:chorismate-pyruvate lyase